jgi:hypothetical protein
MADKDNNEKNFKIVDEDDRKGYVVSVKNGRDGGYFIDKDTDEYHIGDEGND